MRSLRADGWWLAAALALALSGCSAGSASGGAASPAPSPVAISAGPLAGEVAGMAIAADVPYATGPESSALGWKPSLLDVYAPPDAAGLPLVVLFHADPGTTGKEAYSQVAAAIAEEGAVVVVPDWGTRLSPAGMLGQGVSMMQVVDAFRQTHDGAACAVDFAVANAAEYGADPKRLVLMGNSAGANHAMMVSLNREPDPFPGCAAPATGWKARGLMLWEGDWLLAEPSQWDPLEARVRTILALATPWGELDRASMPAVEFAVTDIGRRATMRCEATEKSDWLGMRDPKGRWRAALTTQGAYDDGCIDFGEAAALLASAMRDRGHEAGVLELADPGSTSLALADPDRAAMARHVIALAGR